MLLGSMAIVSLSPFSPFLPLFSPTLFSYLPLSSLLPPTLPLLNPTFSPRSFFVSCNYTPHSADSSALALGVTWVSLHMARCSIIAATSLFSPECLANPVIWDARVRRSSQSCKMFILGVPDWYYHNHISTLTSLACKALSSTSPNSLSLTSLQGVEVWSLRNGRLSRKTLQLPCGKYDWGEFATHG